jgi:hypothetical protein
MWTRFTPWGRTYSRTATIAATAVAATVCVASTSLAGSALSEPLPDSAGQLERTTPKRPLRVLITGFHDWRDLEGNYWRCRDKYASCLHRLHTYLHKFHKCLLRFHKCFP